MTSDSCETPSGAAAALAGVDAVVIPGGFGIRGIEGKVGALRHTRERGIPTLGLCLGLQCMVIEAARHLAGIADANSAEFDPDTPDPVIATMADQVEIVEGHGDMGGTMRLGAYPADARSPVRSLRRRTAQTSVSERHRHRYEVNNAYRAAADATPGWSSPAPRRTAGWSSSSSCPPTSTRSTRAPRRTRSSSRGRRARIRCSSALIGAALDYSDAERLPVEIPEPTAPGRAAHPQRRAGDHRRSRLHERIPGRLEQAGLRRSVIAVRIDDGADAGRIHGGPRDRRPSRRRRHRRPRRARNRSCS